jgi:CheY-like chemotaxis protein
MDAREMPALSTALSGPENRPSLEGKTVVIADDDRIIVDYLALRCRHLGLKVETAGDGLRAVLKVSKERPDLLILDLGLPDVEGFKVVERLADPKFAPVPVIILTGRSDEASKQRCEDLNVFYVHKGPSTWENLEPLIFELLTRPAEREAPTRAPTVKPRVLLVDNDPTRLNTLAHGLQKYGVEVVQGTGGTEGFLLALRNHPDIVVADYDMEQGSGHYLLSRIKSTPSTKRIPVIIYTGKPLDRGHEHAVQRDLRGRGQAAAFLSNALDPGTLVAEMRKHITLP